MLALETPASPHPSDFVSDVSCPIVRGLHCHFSGRLVVYAVQQE